MCSECCKTIKCCSTTSNILHIIRRRWRRGSCTQSHAPSTLSFHFFGRKFIVTNILFGFFFFFFYFLFPFVKSKAYVYQCDIVIRTVTFAMPTGVRWWSLVNQNENEKKKQQKIPEFVENWPNKRKEQNKLRDESQFHGYVHSFRFCIVVITIIGRCRCRRRHRLRRHGHCVFCRPICLFSGDLLALAGHHINGNRKRDRTYPLTWAMIDERFQRLISSVVGQWTECGRRRCIQNSKWTKSIRCSLWFSLCSRNTTKLPW